MGRQYERLSIEDFGAHLLSTGDLDPIYIALHKMRLPAGQLHRWLVAYWCFYHAGVACHMSQLQGEDYWLEMQKAAENLTPAPPGTRWPRGHERRHFRGQQGIDAMLSLRSRYPNDADEWIETIKERANETLAEGASAPFRLISEIVQLERGFGPWIAFKVGDMLERLDILPVSFDQAEVFMFKDPREAALRLWRTKMGLADNARPKDEEEVIKNVVAHLTEHFDGHLAPPRNERGVGLQEIETILCKWKSHMNGHYPLQNDTIEIRAGLREWVHTETAKLMLSNMPEVL